MPGMPPDLTGLGGRLQAQVVDGSLLRSMGGLPRETVHITDGMLAATAFRHSSATTATILVSTRHVA
jgi:hypothetical protein